MKHSKAFLPNTLALVIAAIMSPAFGAAQQEVIEEVIVTGTASPVTQLESSVSISSVNMDEIANFAPRSAAEIFRNIPGIRAEATGGEGNANISVRGLPVASGGAKFLQLQEDGLPVVQFGDIAFGNADIFVRADANVARVESIRGGSASTFASNSPGGIINMISKTGEQAGGSFALSKGVDFDQTRADFAYGAPLGNDWSFHLGGFLREGSGPRDPGYKATMGGQIKANLGRTFEGGFVRFYLKHLDDRSIGYLPMPMRPNGDSLPGFDALSDTPHSVYLLHNLGVDQNGNRRTSDVAEGMHPITTAVGGEFSFELGEGFTLTDKFRKTSIGGRFVSPFPADVGSAQTVADSVGGTGSRLEYANGPMAGQAINPNSLNGNGLAMRIHLFDVELNDLGSFTNDVKLSKELDNMTFNVGLYSAQQAIKTSWLWNSYLMEVKGDNAALLNVRDKNGALMTENGLIAYGVPFWGNCCTRYYGGEYSIEAPYAAMEVKWDQFTLDASVRHDSGSATGSYMGAVQRPDVDMNNDGKISAPEKSVSFVDAAHPNPINYDWSYSSFSLGGTYLIADNLSVFGRVSKGGRANADRLLFGPNVLPDGSLLDESAAVDEVKQIETGVKYKGDNYTLYVTGFFAQTQEQNYEATTQKFFNREYEARGLEVESHLSLGGFSLDSSLTYTQAEIVKDPLNPATVGHTPRRQPDFLYSFTPAYTLGNLNLGANLIGVTSSFAQDNNELEFDGYTQVNAFVNYQLTDNLSLSLNVNNLFDTVGITEAEEGVVPDNGVIRARSINGRSSTIGFKYTL